MGCGGLGDNRELIGREKAGILRPGVPAVIADPEPPASLFGAIDAIGAGPVYRLDHEFTAVAEPGRWHGRVQLPGGGERPVSGPVGPLLPANIVAALQAAAALGLQWTAGELDQALGGMRLTGRRQRLRSAGRDYLLDVAHNPSAVHKLLETIAATYCKGRIIALFSVMRDKDVAAMIEPLLETVDAWCLADQ